jgi:Ferritin-like domain
MKKQDPYSTATSETAPAAVQDLQSHWLRVVGRRGFLMGVGAAGAATLPGSALLASEASARDRDANRLTDGDVAILRFLAAAELIESDLWAQYTELGGVPSDSESPGVPNGGGNTPYVNALKSIDGDMPQYITDNTDDEFSHAAFLNAYLKAHGKPQVNLDEFRTLPSSTATGARNIGRLTNLMALNVDTSWYTRYRSTTNPDFGASFAQLLTITNQPAIPRSDADTSPNSRIQAIANTAAFHFAFIEQGGSSLYTTLLQQVSSLEVLRIVASIGGVEVDHFSLWHDKVSTAVAPPNNVTDPVTGLTFPDLSSNTDELMQTNLILPEPCTFISPSLPLCSVIRPSSTANSGAVAAVNALAADNLFAGQSAEFFRTAMRLARRADAARREVNSSDH